MVQIDRVCFFVENATAWRNWFVSAFGFEAIGATVSPDTRTERVASGSIRFDLAAPRTPESPVARFLQKHPAGVADVVFRVSDLAPICDRPDVTVLQPPTEDDQGQRSACIAAWGSLQHTLVEAGTPENAPTTPNLQNAPPTPSRQPQPAISGAAYFEAIDHVVLNVAAGELPHAVAWYRNVFGFAPQQQFSIATPRSSLQSQVLVHPETGVQFPINEPTSDNSQIQEFLDLNGGAGVQHIALKTPDILTAVPQLRASGVSFLTVPGTYYESLRQKPGFAMGDRDWDGIRAAGVLADWKEGDRALNAPQRPALLLQTFTQPIFQAPTFFFEAIERRPVLVEREESATAQGFGEGNFRALFEAVEREQLQRQTVEGEVRVGDRSAEMEAASRGDRDR